MAKRRHWRDDANKATMRRAQVGNSLLDAYFNDLGRSELLTREQEQVIGKQLFDNERAVYAVLTASPAATREIAEYLSARNLPQGTALQGLAQAMSQDIAAGRPYERSAQEAHDTLTDLLDNIPKNKKSGIVSFYLWARKLAYGLITQGEQLGWDSCPTELYPLRYARNHLESADEAAKSFQQSNLRLVISRAVIYQNKGLPLEDLIAYGNVGLAKASYIFDYRRGCKFSTHAVQWIQQNISRELNQKSRMVRIPVHNVKKAGKIKEWESELAHQFGREPTWDEIALKAKSEGMRVKKDEYEAICAAASQTADIDLAWGSPSRDRDLSEVVNDRLLREDLDRLMVKLSFRERKILQMRYFEDYTLEQVGSAFSISRERVRQIQRVAEKKLRGHYVAALGKPLFE